MHIMLEPAEVTACEISLELYTDIFCGRYDCLEWHTYQSCDSSSYKEVINGGRLLSNYLPIACTCGKELHHNRCIMIHLEKKNFDVLLDAATITMLVYDWKIGEVFEFVIGDKIIRDTAQIVEELYPKIPHCFGTYKEAKRLYDKLQESYNKEYGKTAI